MNFSDEIIYIPKRLVSIQFVVAGGVKVQLCGIAQYANLVGVTVGYTITASISMV